MTDRKISPDAREAIESRREELEALADSDYTADYVAKGLLELVDNS